MSLHWQSVNGKITQDCMTGHNIIIVIFIKKKEAAGQWEGLDDAVYCFLWEWCVSQRMNVILEAGKDKEMGSPSEPPEQPCGYHECEQIKPLRFLSQNLK